MKRVAVLYGGFSKESVISIKSASMVMAHIDRMEYSPTLVFIERKGWYAIDEEKQIPIDKNDFSYTVDGKKHKFDLAFNMIHGTPGEDGTLQGYLDMMAIPHTTGGVLNMSLTFDKEATKALLSRQGFNTAASKLLFRHETYSASGIIEKVGLPCFVKPNRGGSSFGASKVDRTEDLLFAIEKAFIEDDEVLVETYIEGTEVTCGVITHRGIPRSLPITEIVSESEFFDYEAKYLGKSKEITPARIPDDVYSKIQQISEQIFTVLNCRGMIRIDYLIRNQIPFVIEVNTVPGFSEASIIPQQAAADGISKKELISMIIEGALA
jgi:D-alanine-D-alanine ligase